jgi:hypothetical protein
MILLGFGGGLSIQTRGKIIGRMVSAHRMGFAKGLFMFPLGLGITLALATSSFYTSVKTAFLVSASFFFFSPSYGLSSSRINRRSFLIIRSSQLNKVSGSVKSKNILDRRGCHLFFMMGTYVSIQDFWHCMTQAKRGGGGGVTPVWQVWSLRLDIRIYLRRSVWVLSYPENSFDKTISARCAFMRSYTYLHGRFLTAAYLDIADLNRKFIGSSVPW